MLARSKKIEKLYQVSNWLLKCPKISLIVHSNQVSDTVPPFIDRLLALPCDQMTPFVFNQFLLDKSVLHNYNVNFCSQQYLGPSYLSSEHAYLSLLLEILEQKYLHPEIREKGGAYGAKALYKPNQIISLYSYMDPHAEETFQVFENSIRDMLTIDKIPAEELL